MLEDTYVLSNKFASCYNEVETRSILIRSHFEDLRRYKEYRERRTLPIRTIAAETGLSQGAILRVKNVTMERISLSTLAKLCRYFDVKSLRELIEYVPDEVQPESSANDRASK